MSISTMLFLPIAPAGANVCSDGKTSISIEEGNHGEISCTTTNTHQGENLTIFFKNGAKIVGRNERGVEVYIDHLINSFTLDARGEKTSIKGGDGEAGLYVNNRGQGNFNATIYADNVEANENNGVRLRGFKGETRFVSRGTISMFGDFSSKSGTNGWGALHLSSPTAAGQAMITDILVHNIRADVIPSGGDMAGILVSTPGHISVTSTGKVHSKGDGVEGIYVNLLGDARKSVNVTVNDVMTEGKGAEAIVLNRTFPSDDAENAPFNVRIKGQVITTGEEADGVAAEGNRPEISVLIEKSGSIEAKGKNARAIYIYEYDEFPIVSANVTNYGTVIGDILMKGLTAPRFENFGHFVPNSCVELLEGNFPGETLSPQWKCEYHLKPSTLSLGQIVNHGLLSPGGFDNLSDITMASDLEQPKTGILALDVDWKKRISDRIHLKGEADLEGMIRVNHMTFLDPDMVADLDENERVSVTIMTADQGISSLPEVEYADSLLLPMGLRQTATNLILWSKPVNHVDGLNQNQRQVLTEILATRDFNNNFMAIYHNLIPISELSELQLRLDGMGNEAAGAAIQSTIRDTGDFARKAPSCVRDFDDSYPPKRGLCSQMLVTTSHHSRKKSFEERDHQTDTDTLMASFGWRIDDVNLDLEFLLGSNRSQTSISQMAQSNGKSFLTGARIIGDWEPLHFTLTAANNVQTNQINRTIPFNIGTSTAKMRTTSQLIDVEATYQLNTGRVKIAPFGALNLSQYNSRPYQESGASDLSLKVNATKGTLVGARAGVSMTPSQWVENSSISLLPQLDLQWSGSSARPIEFDFEFTGGQNLIRSTTTLVRSRIDASFGLRIRSKSGRLMGYVGVASGWGTSLRQNSVNASLNLHF